MRHITGIAVSLVVIVALTAATGPLPQPVQVRPEPEGITLADPAFRPLPGARADFGRLGGAVYQIEMPARWNGRLVLFMHGFEEFAPEARVTAPDIRRFLIGRGFAWGASSFSSTSLIPGRAADETAALWDRFARMYRRPTRTYVTGKSMGGMATHIAAERYGNRFDGALALCGAAGQRSAVGSGADVFVAGAYAAGVTQAEFDAAPDAVALIDDRILPALRDPRAHERFEEVMVSLTGGPRAFAREGIHLEEETNWRRVRLLVAAGLAPNRDTTYPTAALDRAAVRLPANDRALRSFVAGNDTTGRLRMPLLTLHSTGDGQVPIEQARILRRRVEAAGRRNLLVQRVIRDPSHCGFTTTEFEAGLLALRAWVEHGVRPTGGKFELSPRPGTARANRVRGARDRAVLRGRLTLDGAPFDARWVGAVVRRAGLVTPCQYTLPAVRNGRYEITVLAEAEASGCGAPGAQIVLWTFAGNQKLFAGTAAAWPGNGRPTTVDASFSTTAPQGAAPLTSDFAGGVYRRDGRTLGPGTRVEAYVGATRCGVASVRRTGNFSGYILAAVGPDSIEGCRRGARLTFRIDGRRALDTAVNQPGRGMSLDLTRRDQRSRAP